MNPTPSDPSRFRQSVNTTATEVHYRIKFEEFIEQSPGTHVEKMENFAKFVPRQSLARFLALYEIFKRACNIQGDIIECGVNWGAGLMSFAQFSAALEPVNLQRRIIGFDTFAGFPSISPVDEGVTATSEMRVGGLAVDAYEDLQKCITLFDLNRFIGHIPKLQLVKGDATKTIPLYLEQNTHTVVSLLHLDFDLFEPTKIAIENFLPRMPKGGIIVFDELNNRTWPGETLAVLHTIGLRGLRLERFPFEPHVSFAVLD